jgi:hypothetical protein
MAKNQTYARLGLDAILPLAANTRGKIVLLVPAAGI